MDTIFDHDRLDVYRLATEYTAEFFAVAKGLSGHSSSCPRPMVCERLNRFH